MSKNIYKKTLFASVPVLTYDNDTSVLTIISKVITWILNFSGAVAVLFIIYAGFLYITSAGNQDRQKVAKKTLTYAVIGLIIIIVSEFLVQFVVKNVNTVL